MWLARLHRFARRKHDHTSIPALPYTNTRPLPYDKLARTTAAVVAYCLAGRITPLVCTCVCVVTRTGDGCSGVFFAKPQHDTPPPTTPPPPTLGAPGVCPRKISNPPVSADSNNNNINNGNRFIYQRIVFYTVCDALVSHHRVRFTYYYNYVHIRRLLSRVMSKSRRARQPDSGNFSSWLARPKL